MAGMRSAMRSPMRSALDQALGTAYMSLANQALAILRKFGTDAHVYLPGASGVAVSGLPTNNYTLSDGSTGYSAVDGTVGRVLDAAGAVGAELSAIYGSSVTATSTLTLTSATVVNALYKVRCVVNKTGGTSIDVGLLNASSGWYSGGAQYITANGVTTVEFYVTASDTGGKSGVIFSGGATGSVTEFSVKQVTGIHATQATTANKPTVRRGSLNRLLQSGAFGNAAWTKTFGGTGVAPTCTDSYGTAPDGTSTASRIQFDRGVGVTGSDVSYVTQTGFTMTAATASVWLKTNDATTKPLELRAGTAAGTLISVTPTWQRFTVSVSSSGDRFAILYYGNDGGPQTADILAWHPQYEDGLTAGDYSPTTSAAASNPSAGRYSWGVDTDDSLVFGAVPFQFTDDYFVCIGAACNNKASYPGVLDATGSTARMYLYFDASGVVVSNYKTDAAVDTYVQGPAFVDGAAGVISMYKQSGQVCTGWNGVDGTPAAAPAGTYTITAAKLSNLLNGLIAPAVLIKGTVSAADRLTIKRWVASLTPNGPTF